LRRSSLKERGRVKTFVTSDLGCLRPWRTRQGRRRGQGSGGARPRSGRRALRLAPGSTNNVGGGDSAAGGSSGGEKGFDGALVRAGDPGGGQARVGLPVIPTPRQESGMMGFAVYWPAGSINGGDHAKFGGHDLHDPRRPGKPRMVFMPPSAGAPGHVRGRRAARRRRTPAGTGQLRHCRCCARGGRRHVPAADRPRCLWRRS
jgi:hypothetical protein